MTADPLDQSDSQPVTLYEWTLIREAHDFPVTVAIRKMLEDIEAGHMAIVERQRHALPLH